jgi:hypothetical protein
MGPIARRKNAAFGPISTSKYGIPVHCSFKRGVEPSLLSDRPVRGLCNKKGEAMKKTWMALAAVATLAVSAVGAPAPAHAQRGLGAAVAGGLIGGAIVGGALAGPRYYGPGYYGPGYGYGYYGPAYAGDYGPCYWQRQRFWDGYGWRIRRVRVCG